MTLRTRLALSLAAIALLLALPLALAFRALGHTEATTKELRTQVVAGSLLLARIRVTTDRLRADDQAVVLVGDDPQGAITMQSDARTLRALADSVRPFDLQPLSAQLERTLAALDRYGPIEADAARARLVDSAEHVSEQHIIPALTGAARALVDAEAALGAVAELRSKEAEAAAEDARYRAIALFVAAGAGALAIAIWLTRSISRPVADLERGMAAVADGRFGHRLTVAPSRRDEFGRLAESYQEMAAQLAELDKLRAEFVSIASHELKTPINVMLGYLTLLLEELYGPVPEAQRPVLRTLETQGQSLARLVQHLLDVSRFQAGAGRLEVRPLALRPFLADVASAHAVLAAQRGLTFRAQLSDALPDVVTWDADRVREVLDNLLANAVKFTEAQGEVALTAEPCAADGAAAIAIEVRDSGVGIPREQLTRIFEKFFQATNQDGAAAKGTGLGLAIAKGIVEAHGGRITVDSAPGRGTRFAIVLPVVSTDGTVPQPGATRPTGPAAASAATNAVVS